MNLTSTFNTLFRKKETKRYSWTSKFSNSCDFTQNGAKNIKIRKPKSFIFDKYVHT